MNDYEVERKRAVPSHKADNVLSELKRQRFTLVEKLDEEDTYFSRADIDYMKTVECLRVRRKSGFSEITYKPPTVHGRMSKSGITAKRELNVMLHDEGQAQLAVELLKIIGLVPLVRVVKRRQVFRSPDLPRVSIALDVLERVGQFIEIEVMATDKDEALRMIEVLERDLGVESFEVATLPYRDLVMAAQEQDATDRP
jgi:adenylate cyclase, class 2